MSRRSNIFCQLLGLSILPISFIFSATALFSQNQLVDSVVQASRRDSIRRVLTSHKEDTAKVNLLNVFSEKMRAANEYDTAAEFGEKALTLATKLNFKKGIAAALRNVGTIYSLHGEYQKAIDCALKALDINKEIGNKYGIARNLGTIGNAYLKQGEYAKALDYEFKALAIATETTDSDAKANTISTIGDIYYNQGNYSKALDFDFKALEIKQALGDQRGISRNYYLIGNLYQSQGNYDKALEYDQKALAINHKLGSKYNIAANLTSIGEIYRAQGKLNAALQFFNNALSMDKDIGAKNSIAINLSNIGNTYFLMGNKTGMPGKTPDTLDPKALSYYSDALGMMQEIGNKTEEANILCDMAHLCARQKNYKLARDLADSSLHISTAIGQKEGIRNSYRLMAELDSALGFFRAGWDDYKAFIAYRDSLTNELNAKKTMQAEMNFQFEQMQAKEKAEQEKKDMQNEQDRKKQALILKFFMAGFVMVLALAFFIFRGYRQKQKANVIITKQKDEVEKQKEIVESQKQLVEQQKAAIEEKQKEILDSIHYAQRIQHALLASDSLLGKHLKEYFVLFKPKDIVSGDFYWATAKDNRFYLAVCDSTGHGVPGAFMSLLNISFMNEAINEKNMELPSDIFNHARKRLIENVSQEGGQDGMDGILLDISYDPLYIRYSAAFNAPVLIRDNQIIELQGDKMPVGASPRDKESFTPFGVELKKNDLLYAFTDGFADQFGGAKGKKYKYRQLCEKLLTVCNSSLNEQKKLLDSEFEKWRGELEQIDDVLIIGIRV